MKLNLGSNKHRLEGYINVDILVYPGVDLIADVYHLPYRDGSADEIYAGHLLEHLANPVDFFLECWRVLRPVGKLTVVIPDMAAIAPYPEMAVGILFGFWLNDNKPDPAVRPSLHRSWWNLDTLSEMAKCCGFKWHMDIDPWKDRRLVTGANWQCGAEFIRVAMNPIIPYAAQLYHQIDRGEL